MFTLTEEQRKQLLQYMWQRPRIKTKVSRAAKARRVDVKKQQGAKKSMRKKVEF